MNENTLICIDCEKILPEDDYGRQYGHKNCNVISIADAKNTVEKIALSRPEMI